MGAVTAGRDAAIGGRPVELRGALERTLAAAAADERVGPAIAATNLRLRLELTDLGLVLNLHADDRGGGLRWWFGDDPRSRPRLTMAMDSEVANRYLQGTESLAIAIARGRVRVSGEPRAALLYLPAARLICEPYRDVVQSHFPDLVSREEKPD